MYGVPTDEIDNIEFQYQTRIGHLLGQEGALFCMHEELEQRQQMA